MNPLARKYSIILQTVIIMLILGPISRVSQNFFSLLYLSKAKII